ncbi:MAG: hypothetical protein P4K94_02340 [Terracidiphilus sp.]|nr:hypothetical protein [Terracidiphilus sp.]
MKSNLFSQILAPVVLAAAAVTAIPAMAATSTVKVPFNFTVGGKPCPAGEYSVDFNPMSKLVRLQSVSTSKSFIWPVRAAEQNIGGVVLKFDEQSQTHALRSIQYGSAVTAQLDNIKKGKTEDASAGSAAGH